MQYAFCDEFGAFGFSFEKPNVSTHFIITAIIVNDSDMPALRDSVEAVRKNIFRLERWNQVILKTITLELENFSMIWCHCRLIYTILLLTKERYMNRVDLE